MSGARYWRLISMQARVQGQPARLRAVHLYRGAARVDELAVLSSALPVLDGDLDLLQDVDNDVDVTLDLSVPAAALCWDFGAPAEVTDAHVIAATDESELLAAVLQSSADGHLWQTQERLCRARADAPCLLRADKFNSFVDLFARLDGDLESDASARSLVSQSFPAYHVFSDGHGVYTRSLEVVGNTASQTLLCNTGQFTVEDFTIEFLYKRISAPSAGATVLDNRAATGTYRGFLLSFPGANVGGLAFYAGRGTGSWDAQITPVQTLSVGDWHHIAIVRFGDVIMLFVDGEKWGDAVLPANANIAANSNVYFASNVNGTVSVLAIGLFNDLRITRGVARYIDEFVPPLASINPRVERSVIVDAVPRIARMDYVGDGRIAYTVKEASDPIDLPRRRRVVLHDERSHRPIRETWSRADDGRYEFDGLDANQKYYAVAFDHTGRYTGVVATGLKPEPQRV